MGYDRPRGWVRKRTRGPGRVRTLDDAFDWDDDAVEPPDNLQERLRFIEAVHPDYRPIFLNHMMLRMIGMQTPYDQIAFRFGVSMTAVFNWLERMRAWVAEEGLAEREVDVLALIGGSMMNYEDTRNQLLSLAGSSTVAPGVRVAALRGAGALEDSKNKVRQACGVFDGGPLRRTTEAEDDAQAALALRRAADKGRKVLERLVENEPEVDYGVD